LTNLQSTHFWRLPARPLSKDKIKPINLLYGCGFPPQTTGGVRQTTRFTTKSPKPLTKHQQNRNLLISKKHYIIERVFGTLKKCYDLARSSYIGTSRVQGEFNLCSFPLKTVSSPEWAENTLAAGAGRHLYEFGKIQGI
jgi:hypothetical protein